MDATTALDPTELTFHVESELARWNAPGAALTAVKDGTVVLARGFGRRDPARDLPVTPATLFDHGSTCKAFTAVLAATLVDDGLADWDRPIRDRWPAFRLHDPVATERVTLTDLLAHRAGLARHEWAWLANPSLTRDELMRRLRHLEPGHDLRAAWEYGNLGYAAVGAFIGAVTGSTWEHQLRARVLEPLGMARTLASADEAPAFGDRARPYVERDGKAVEIEHRPMAAIAPAGMLLSCAEDIARWLLFQLGDGRAEGRRVLSEAALAATHRIHAALDLPPDEDGTRYLGYALGWVVGTWRGRRMLWHSGGVDGFRTEIMLLPDDGVGVAASVNHTHTGLLPAALGGHVADLLLGEEPLPRSARLRERWERETSPEPEGAPEPPAVPGTSPSRPVAAFAGAYEHPGYGRLAVAADGAAGLRVTLGETELAAAWRHLDTWTVRHRHPDPALEQSWPLTFVTGPDGAVAEALLPLEESLPPIRFRRTAPPAAPDRSLDAARWRRRLTELLGRVEAPGAIFAIMHGDEVMECAAGLANLDTRLPMTTGTRVPIASITKVYTATLVMQLVDDGLLDLDRPIRDYLPDFRVADPDATERLTARHLLTHTGGIDGDKEDSFGRGDDALARYVASCATLGQIHDVGATLSYCNSGYAILGHLVATLRGKTWDDAVREHLCAPLGAAETATLPEDLIWSRLAAGHQTGDDGRLQVFPVWEGERSTGPAGGVVTTMADLLRFVRMHLDQGVAADGTRVLSERSAAAMLTPQVEVPNPFDGTTHWGLGWELADHGGPRTLAGHGGDLIVHHARLTFCPQERFVVALLVNGDGVDHIAEPMFREALSMIGVSLPEPPAPPPAPARVDPSAVAGVYSTIAVRAAFTPSADGLDGRFRIVSERIAALLPESQRERRVAFRPVTPSLYVGRMGDDEAWTPAVFYEANGHRYVHLGLRAMRATGDVAHADGG